MSDDPTAGDAAPLSKGEACNSSRGVLAEHLGNQWDSFRFVQRVADSALALGLGAARWERFGKLPGLRQVVRQERVANFRRKLSRAGHKQLRERGTASVKPVSPGRIERPQQKE